MTLFSSVDLTHDDLFLTHELLAAGYNDKSIKRGLGSGRLLRLHHGAYTFPDRWGELDGPEQRMLVARAHLRRASTDMVLSDDTAADVHDVPLWEPTATTHLARLDQRAGRRTASKAQHRGVMLAEDVTVRHGLPVTSGTRTALDIITTHDTEHALVAVCGLMAVGETSTDQLYRRAGAFEHHPGSLSMPLVIGLADPRCESVAERRVLYLCWRQHLPTPVPQHPIFDGRGRLVAELDFAWPEAGVFLEFDGKIKYTTLLRPGETAADVLLREKERQQLVIGLTGWRCIRMTWADFYRPERTAARIRRTLAGRPWAA